MQSGFGRPGRAFHSTPIGLEPSLMALGKALGCGLACKWETLALWEVATVEPGVCFGSFSHWPQFRCVGWIGPDAVATVAWETR